MRAVAVAVAFSWRETKRGKRRDPCGFFARGVTPALMISRHHQTSNAFILLRSKATPLSDTG
jgi:hypothetical protein